MKDLKLTSVDGNATEKCIAGRGAKMDRKVTKAGLVGVGVLGLGGCINVAAPEEPIVIELNINIQAEVLYRLAEDAENTIEENADIF